jgi:ATP-binding cassette subfamily F protein 3
MPCSAFSGGWRMRVALAGVLFAQPDILLLDEPTNYLDLEGALWLESYLARYPHTVLIISHDRGLLNRAVDHILHLEGRKLTLYSGGYDAFARARAETRAVQAAAAKKQEAERAHLQGLRRPVQGQGVQGETGAVPRQDAGADDADPHAGGRRADGLSFPVPEALSPPIVNLDSGRGGLWRPAGAERLSLRIDQDDRIALSGPERGGKIHAFQAFGGQTSGGGRACHGVVETAHRLFRAAPGR